MVPVIELKDTEMTDEGLQRLIDMIRNMDDGEMLRSARLVSFYPEMLLRAKEYTVAQYGIEPFTSYVIGSRNIGEGLPTIQEAYAYGFSGISINKNLMKKKYYDYLESHGMAISFWTFKSSVADENMLYRYLKVYKEATITTDGIIFDQ